MSLSTFKGFLPSLRVYANFKYRFAVFACLCLSLGVFVNLNIFLPSLRVFVRDCVSLSTSNVFLPSLCVFARLCPSLCVFACLCVSLRSLGVFAVFR